MELPRQKWYVRWFFWSLAVVDAFTEHDGAWKYHDHTTLCHFFRVTLLWCPLVLMAHLMTLGVFFLLVIMLPTELFGGVAYLKGLGTLLAVVVISVCLWAAIKQVLQPVRDAQPQSWVPTVALHPSFLTVLGVYIAAIRQRMCPRVTFVDNEEVSK